MQISFIRSSFITAKGVCVYLSREKKKNNVRLRSGRQLDAIRLGNAIGIRGATDWIVITVVTL